MALLNIRKFPDPALKDPAKAVANIDGGLTSFIESMVQTMYAAPGVGLAAPQIGVLKRFIIVAPPSRAYPLFMVNPEIVDRSREMSSDYEGCLSYPGISNYIERHDAIKVRWLNYVIGETTYRDGAFVMKEMEFTGFTARILQHEIDHLDGICQVGDARKVPSKRRTRSRASVMAGLTAMTVLGAGAANWRSA